MVIELLPNNMSAQGRKIALHVLNGLFLNPIPPNAPIVPVAMRLTAKIGLDMTDDEAIIEEAVKTVAYAVGKVGDHGRTVHDMAVHPTQVTLIVNDHEYARLPRPR